MIVVGLTGGIGSGKSTVADMLVGKGAVLIDADVVAHDVLESGRPAYRKVVERFGEQVVTSDGAIDRGRLADTVFKDRLALADLEAIVHPEVRAEIGARIASQAGSDHVVVVDIALLVEKGVPDGYNLAGVLVVDAPVEVAIERLVNLRHMERTEAQARIANQATRSERLERADFVIMNMGTLEELAEMVRRAWEWMQHLPAEADGQHRVIDGS